MLRQVFSATLLTSVVFGSTIVLSEGMHHHKDSPKSEAKSAGKPETKKPMGAEPQHPEHLHGSIAIPKGQPIPTVKLVITPDTMAGWNMQVQTENFTFAPERVGQSSSTTEGHAHLFLNGRKIARLYGPWSHIPKLPAGKNELRVSLNTNNHEDLTVDGKSIAATAIVEVPASSHSAPVKPPAVKPTVPIPTPTTTIKP